jgi:hypothetical protein
MGLHKVLTYEVCCDGSSDNCIGGEGAAGQFNYWNRKQVEEYLISMGWIKKGREWFCPRCSVVVS